MFNPKSDYALNKLDKDAIVYSSATGVHIRLTREDFSSEEEFLCWKAWSDGDYKAAENDGRDYYDNCLSLAEALKSSDPSAEDAFFAPLLKVELREQKTALLQQLTDILTEKQYRRLCLYYLEGKSEAEIASLEHVNQSSVSRSINSGTKIVEKIFEKVLRATA